MTWHTFINQALIISIGRLEATADADGDIRRSSQLDHSKGLDLYYSELYWSSFLGSVQKKMLQKKNGLSGKTFGVCMFSHGNRISARKSAFHHKVATNDQYSFYGEKNFDILVEHNSGPKSQFQNCDKKSHFCHNFEIVTSVPGRIMPHQNIEFFFSIKKCTDH